MVVEEEPETATVRVPLGQLLLVERESRVRDQDKDGSGASVRTEEPVRGGDVLPRARTKGA